MPSRGELTSIHVRRAVDGECESLEWVVGHLDPLVRAQVRRRLGAGACNRADVDDLAADVWAVALRRIGDLQPRAGRWAPVLVAFLASTTTNVCNSFLRRTIRARLAGDESSRTPRIERVVDPTRGVLTRVGDREAHEVVQAALARLSDDKREVLLMRLLEQRDNQDIAASLGIPANTVAQRYRRALVELRAILPAGVYCGLRDLTWGGAQPEESNA